MISRRAELGQWFTAQPVAELAIAALGGVAGASVLDPTCGDGAFLAAAGAARSRSGIDIDPEAAALARTRLPDATIVVGDMLATEHAPVDIVVGNPPYVRSGRVAPEVRAARAAMLAADWPELDAALVAAIARHADVAATCLLRALRWVRPGGQLALVMSTALLDADHAAALWTAVESVARVEALITAPTERWFADAWVNPMLLIARRRGPEVVGASTPRLLRLTQPTREVAARATCLADIAAHADERHAPDRASWGAVLRSPAVWFRWRELAGAQLVPLRELAELRRGLTTGANHVFYLRRSEARALGLEKRFLAPVVRSPFNGAPAPIAVAPDESPLVAISVPPDAKPPPRIAAWFARHEAAALATSAARRDPWWSLPVYPARLFMAKAYGPRFVQRLADEPMLADQRVYAVHPRAGVELEPLAAVLNALPTALALEALGRGSMGYGAVEWTVADAHELPVLDVRRASPAQRAELTAALHAIARRPIGHVRSECAAADRAALDRAALALAPGSELHAELWAGLLASVALRDRYLLPSV